MCIFLIAVLIPILRRRIHLIQPHDSYQFKSNVWPSVSQLQDSVHDGLSKGGKLGIQSKFWEQILHMGLTGKLKEGKGHPDYKNSIE